MCIVCHKNWYEHSYYSYMDQCLANFYSTKFLYLWIQPVRNMAISAVVKGYKVLTMMMLTSDNKTELVK